MKDAVMIIGALGEESLMREVGGTTDLIDSCQSSHQMAIESEFKSQSQVCTTRTKAHAATSWRTGSTIELQYEPPGPRDEVICPSLSDQSACRLAATPSTECIACLARPLASSFGNGGSPGRPTTICRFGEDDHSSAEAKELTFVYIICSILLSIFVLPFGLAALIYSIRAYRSQASGRADLTQRLTRIALMLILVGSACLCAAIPAACLTAAYLHHSSTLTEASDAATLLATEQDVYGDNSQSSQRASLDQSFLKRGREFLDRRHHKTVIVKNKSRPVTQADGETPAGTEDQGTGRWPSGSGGEGRKIGAETPQVSDIFRKASDRVSGAGSV